MLDIRKEIGLEALLEGIRWKSLMEFIDDIGYLDVLVDGTFSFTLNINGGASCYKIVLNGSKTIVDNDSTLRIDDLYIKVDGVVLDITDEEVKHYLFGEGALHDRLSRINKMEEVLDKMESNKKRNRALIGVGVGIASIVGISLLVLTKKHK